jgi:GT2 family glycosyltransferase
MEWKKMISQVIVANNNWGDFATPFVDSVLKHYANTEIILVDNGSKKPYKKDPRYKLIRLEAETNYNYMKALNVGMRETTQDWMVIGNDDVLCTGPFFKKITSLPVNMLHGPEVRRKKAYWGIKKSFFYLYGWIIIMHKSVYKKIGDFDEAFLHAGFDDIDYSWRAQQLGIHLNVIDDIPFVHLADMGDQQHRRREVPGFHENMAKSKEHFVRKVLGE